ncbi:1269_t:CDS:2, partial [Entrophospora sp. SA101]
HLVGSIEVGKVADLAMYNPAFFGTKPEIVIKSGVIVWSQMGDANASIPTTQPVISRPMFGSYGSAAAKNSFAFVSQLSLLESTVPHYGLKKKIEAVKKCRNIGKKDMKLNDYLPKIEVDPETYVVKADGVDHHLGDMHPAEAARFQQIIHSLIDGIRRALNPMPLSIDNNESPYKK